VNAPIDVKADLKRLPIVHHHWLFGRGPDKVLEFKEPVRVETNCQACAHNKVCGHVMDKRCVNYEFGSSSNTGCGSCHHMYTRWDPKDRVPCFNCKDFLPRSAVKKPK